MNSKKQTHLIKKNWLEMSTRFNKKWFKSLEDNFCKELKKILC